MEVVQWTQSERSRPVLAWPRALGAAGATSEGGPRRHGARSHHRTDVRTHHNPISRACSGTHTRDDTRRRHPSRVVDAGLRGRLVSPMTRICPTHVERSYSNPGCRVHVPPVETLATFSNARTPCTTESAAPIHNPDTLSQIHRVA